LSRALRNGFHSLSSISSASLNDGIVLPIYLISAAISILKGKD
jgi:hypothetical protein